MCVSNDRLDLNSVMIRKASKAAFALSTMLSSSTSATLLNRLFSQLIESIPMLTLSSARSGSSNSRLPHPHISMRTLATSALLLFGSGVPATGWISSWGRHTGIPRSDRRCRFCSSAALGDHAFKCPAFLDLGVFCDINVLSKPQFITLMTDFPIAAQCYITLLTSRIKLR